jgi:hypothetical protein
VDRLGFAVDADLDLAGFGRGDAVVGDLAVFPFDVHGEAAPRPQTGDLAIRPGVGQRGQERKD